jgi:2-dehydropantoate 2-reductase
VKIAIIGAGAIGGYYGTLLALQNHEVHFLLRSDAETVRERGWTLHTCGATLRLPEAKVHTETASIGRVDLVMVALKTTSNELLPGLLPPLLSDETRVLTLQNGLGNEEFLARILPAHRVLGGLCSVRLNRTAPGEITHYGHGSITLGCFQRAPDPFLRTVADHFTGAGVQTQTTDRLEEARWKKLVWNVAFNGLAIAAGNATVDIVLGEPPLRSAALTLMREIIAIAQASGHTLPEQWAEFQLDRSENMGAYRASSLLDYQLGRPVEVEAIWGEPLRKAQALGVATPALAQLYAVLQRLCRINAQRTAEKA